MAKLNELKFSVGRDERDLILIANLVDGYSIVAARSNFRIGGQETAPQSLTVHTLVR